MHFLFCPDVNKVNSIRHLIYILFFSFYLITSIDSQEIDTAIEMSVIEIEDQNVLTRQYDSVEFDEILEFQHSLSGVLRSKYNVYFKDYGPGSSSTIALNGGKASEVALVWNGIRLNNPMLGLNDFSMIHASDISSLKMVGLTSNNIYGAGSVAGTVLIDTDAGKGLYSSGISSGFSTLNQYKINLKLGWKVSETNHKISLSTLQAQNNYKYEDRSGVVKRLPHANHHYYNANYDFNYKFRGNAKIKASIWVRDQFRQIPPILTSTNNEATQGDQFVRSMVQYSSISTHHLWDVRAFYSIQNQNYTDPAINLDAHHQFDNFQLRIDNQWLLPNSWSLRYGSNYSYFSSRSDNYRDPLKESRMGIYGQLSKRLDKIPLNVSFLIRPEIIFGYSQDLVADGRINYELDNGGNIAVYGGRNVVLPTFNDRFWEPGGNPELLPERNWMYGVQYQFELPYQLNSRIEIFGRSATDWIQWLPKGGIWSPDNYHKARNYGAKLYLEKNLNHFKAQVGYQWVRTYLLENRNEYKQTIYTPKHLASANFSYDFARFFSANVDLEYTSKRYTLSDHSDYLPGFFLIHPALQFRSGNGQWKVVVGIQNVLNHQYHGIKNRPMPGTTFQINTNYNFNL